MFRTDRNRNPTAFIVQLAAEAGLVLGVDYQQGDSFEVNGQTFFTAKLLGDPGLLTIRVIDKVGFRTLAGAWRWTYVKMPAWVWQGFTAAQKLKFIGYMYAQEGGTEMKGLFPA